ncbi:hypothetical protein DOK67_0000796 [Enterococcus sp. DIV0212c]|uniref:hypothetical protein n=1 Tax=Enterococcus sp. DIV0212c TaxID=2230867 RepID=UPI001A9BCD34|nr:hypothetical protein [Enterococcus sp. DIV0212c]MBO1354999.1 hypothetical protein [Enterococcus sp. DIV0212c]
MKNKRKKRSFKGQFFLISLFTVFFILGIWGTRTVYAALTATDQVTNDFQVNNLSGTIKESFVPPTVEDPMTPGRTYPKEVTVTNPSGTSFFVRVLVTPEIQSADGILLAGNIGKELTIDLGKDWLLGEDGYYYYLGKVEKDQTTSPLFTQVTLVDNLDEAYNGASMQIHIKSETIITGKQQYRDAWWNGKVPTASELLKIDTKLQSL